MAENNYSRSGAYANPMLIYNQEFDAFTKGIDDFKETMQKTAVTLAANNAEQRRSQEELEEKQNKYQAEMYKKVTELPETGYGTFDHNKDLFFDEQVDKYFDIKNGMENGSISSKDGNKALAMIDGQVASYKAAAPEILALAKEVQDAMKIPNGEPGSMSGRTPTAQQSLLLNLIQGGDVAIVDRGGDLFLYQPESEGNPEGMINIQEIINQQKSGKSFVQTVPDIAPILTSASTNIIGSSKTGGMNAAFVSFEKQNINGQEVTTQFMDAKQRAAAADSLIKTKQLDPILNNEKTMESVWFDMMGKDSDWGVGTEEEVKAQRDEAARFLAEKAIEDNTAMEGVKQIISRKDKSSGGRGGKGKSPWTLATTEEYDLNKEEYQQFVKDAPGYVKSPKALTTKLKDINPGIEYKALDKSMLGSPERMEKLATYLEDLDYEEGTEPYTVEDIKQMLEDYGRIIIIDDDWGAPHPIGSEEEIIDLLAQEEGVSKKGRKALKKKNPYQKASIESDGNKSKSAKEDIDLNEKP